MVISKSYFSLPGGRVRCSWDGRGEPRNTTWMRRNFFAEKMNLLIEGLDRSFLGLTFTTEGHEFKDPFVGDLGLPHQRRRFSSALAQASTWDLRTRTWTGYQINGLRLPRTSVNLWALVTQKFPSGIINVALEIEGYLAGKVHVGPFT